MNFYFEAIEDHPDTSIHCGVIREDGARWVWLKAANTAEVHMFLSAMNVFPNRVRPLPRAHGLTHAEGLDFDLTTNQIDRTVIPPNADVPPHRCAAFKSEWRGGEIILKCIKCGAIMYDEPRPLGGYYSS